MTQLAPHEEAAPFLRLPAETRLHIYSYLIPEDRIEIDLCTSRRSELEHHPADARTTSVSSSSSGRSPPRSSTIPTPKRSIISGLVAQVIQLETITRTNGLHLLLVCRRTRDEVRSLLSTLPVRFHCPKCFEELLRNLSFGLGVGVKWMRHVEIVVNCGSGLFGPPFRPLTDSLAKFMVTETLQAARRTGWLYYGRLDLAGREEWKYEPLPADPVATTAESPSPPTVSAGALQTQTQNQLPPNAQFPVPADDHSVAAAGLGVQQSMTNGLQQQRGVQPRGPPEKWLISGWFSI
ncbi:hypothetical protein A1O1_06211 [Capronia coronata CBS 617.96]|uniref:Uncharacterized protein n=1 Tax=Capronia coronata CBS 617.96 TaxID=1182541 RepID=W9XZA3_9EURO|nr:uncharacterized protein A1O1_06211 [Capronia coronata CBS 617.96]EXJ85842.1 hypothetical protein A1O1_06211 [Capronia coronata CBS 617.96]